MVRVEDKTNEELKKRIKFLKSEKLIREVFGEFFDISVSEEISIVRIGENGKERLYVDVDYDKGYLYSKKFEVILKKFGKIYEKVLNVKNFNIKTDYSNPPA